ncbi:response regulator [Ramlibacter tataouinensis]|uniref:response regulator n=1 Tax=Ramlibacter tataouinensis TaxID=94132 RepID=UPI0022F39EF2|nr:response regulator [Ramlibacter tataouinensis]WBY02434.1 response regulator [Ramlibacter tataouinensis]
MRVLVVEDDRMIGEAVQGALRADHWAADWVRDADQADAALAAGSYDAVVLDLGLPRGSGLDVLARLRARGNRVPVLVATARDAVADRVAGLDAGADDYLVKPFDTSELLARLRALVRRSAGRGEALIRHRDVVLNPATREATLAGRPVALSAREWAVLEPMLLRPGVVFSRAQLEEKLYGWKEDISSNAVEVYVHGVRKKLGAGLIQTVRGLGYVVPRE